jgi:hypothetical protein
LGDDIEIFINEIPDEGLHQSGTLSAEAFDLAKSDPIQPIDRKLLFQGQNSSRLRPSGWMGCKHMPLSYIDSPGESLPK